MVAQPARGARVVAASIGTVGDATIELLDGRDLVTFAVGWMREDLRPT